MTPSASGDGSGVDVFAVPVPDVEWDKSILLGFEREMLGLYVSDHPLLGVEHILASAADASVADLLAEATEETGFVTVAGILSSVSRKVSKNGSPWAQVILEDLTGAVEVLFFPATYAEVGMSIAEDAIVVVRGRVDHREDSVKIIARELSLPDLTVAAHGPVTVSLSPSRCTPPLVDRLREVLAAHPGTTEVRLELRAGERVHRLKLPDGLRVTPSPALMGDLKALLGPAAVAA